MIRDKRILLRDIARHGYVDKVTALNFHILCFLCITIKMFRKH